MDVEYMQVREKTRRASLAATKADYLTIFIEELLQPLVIHVVSEVLDVDVGEFLGFGAELGLPLFARLETTHEPAERGGRGDAHSFERAQTEEEKPNKEPSLLTCTL